MNKRYILFISLSTLCLCISMLVGSLYDAYAQSLKTRTHDEKIVCLVFDDALSSKTEQLLSILNTNHVHATFILTHKDHQHKKIVALMKKQGNKIIYKNHLNSPLPFNTNKSIIEFFKPLASKYSNYFNPPSSSKQKIVLIIHDANTKQSTLDALPQVIKHYQELGYEFRNDYYK